MTIRQIVTARFLALSLVVWIGCDAALAQTAPAGQNRPRRAAPAATPATVAPTAAPPAPVAPAPSPQIAPTPQVTASPTPLPVPATVDELRDAIQAILRQPELAPIHLGVKIKSLETGRDIFESNSRKLLMPASNMKSYTFSAALVRLGPEFRFRTSLYGAASPDAAGTVRGDVILYGRGDPTFAASLNNGDYYKTLNDFAAKLAASGLKRIEGDLIGDESYFTGPPLGFGWEWDDLAGYYAAPVSALTINDNAVDVYAKPGPAIGAPALVSFGPSVTGFTIKNGITTGAAGTPRSISLRRVLGTATLELTGSVPLDDKAAKNGYEDSVALSDPALVFTTLFREALGRNGISVTGRLRTVDARTRPTSGLADLAQLKEIGFWDSPPLRQIMADALKPSQNLYTELTLRALGRYALDNPALFPTPAPAPPVNVTSAAPNTTATAPAIAAPRNTTEAGIEAVQAFLVEAGIPANTIFMMDGSGLSRHNLVTTQATATLYEYMSRHRYAPYFYDAQPVGGVDGTLRNRFKGTPAEKNVRAKTGTINYVAALSGYVTSAAGERFVFSIIVNNYPADGGGRRRVIDDIVVLLASLKSRSAEK